MNQSVIASEGALRLRSGQAPHRGAPESRGKRGDSTRRAIAAALARDLDGGFERFVLTYQDRIYAFALNLIGNRATAEDVAQETFVAAYRALQKYSPARRRTLALRAWLYTIVLNRVRNLARSQQSKVLSLDEPARDDLGISRNGHTSSHARAALDLADDTSGPVESVEREESAEELRAALARLALRYRSAVVLRHIEERDYAEIAAILNQPVGTVKSNVHRGLALLRTDLERKQHGKQFAALA